MADLIFFHRGQPLLRESLESKLEIGRHRDNDVCLLDGVSPFHAVVEALDGGIVLNAKDGPVFLNGERVAKPQRLKDGDLFDLGGYRCQFFETTRSLFNPARSEKTATSGGDATDGATRGALPAIHFLSPSQKRFKRTRLLIGRAPSCDFVLENGFISSQHAEVFFHDGEYRLRDLHSRNGTFLNDVKITERALLPEGVIRLGRLALPYQIEAASNGSSDIPGIVLPGLRPGEGERMLVGASKPFQNLLNRLKKIAAGNEAVLLLGPTGVGKDLIAHYLHAMNPKRKAHPYVPVNCAAIPQNLAESQLFGHTRGAFSGAQNDHRGFFQEAHKGTLFLDEIGELPIESQARLLRVIEDGYVRPVGGNREIALDVRLIFATNRDLDTSSGREGNFREDLFQRFQWIVKIPSLAERSEDVPHLVRYFLRKHAPKTLTISAEALAVLQKMAWPGNIRELNRAVRRAIANAVDRGADAVTLEDFELHEFPVPETEKPSEQRQEKRRSLKKTLESLSGNISHAAKALGVSRVTLHKWIDEDGIDVSRFKD